MKLKWTPWKVINRFWKTYISDNEWILEAKTKEEMEIFVAYGFKLVEEPKVVEEVKPLKAKNK